MPILSIVIPVYNAEKTIKYCVESILSQTFMDIEIICVNDGSTDNSLVIISEIANNDSRVIVLDQVNKGASEARNLGVQHSRGEYITFVDADDWLEKYAYESCIEKMENHGLDVVEFNCNYLYDNPQDNIKQFYSLNEQIVETTCGKAFNYELSKSHVVWNKIFKRRIIIDNQLEFKHRDQFVEDFLFNAQYYIFVSRVGYINDALYNYVQHDSMYMSSYKAEWIYRYLGSIHEYYVKKKSLFSEENVLNEAAILLFQLIREWKQNCLTKGIAQKDIQKYIINIFETEFHKTLRNRVLTLRAPIMYFFVTGKGRILLPKIYINALTTLYGRL